MKKNETFNKIFNVFRTKLLHDYEILISDSVCDHVDFELESIIAEEIMINLWILINVQAKEQGCKKCQTLPEML